MTELANVAFISLSLLHDRQTCKANLVMEINDALQASVDKRWILLSLEIDTIEPAEIMLAKKTHSFFVTRRGKFDWKIDPLFKRLC